MQKNIEINSRTQVTVVQAQLCVTSTTANLSAGDFTATMWPIFRNSFEFQVWDDGKVYCIGAGGPDVTRAREQIGNNYYLKSWYAPDRSGDTITFTEGSPPVEKTRPVQPFFKFSIGAWSRLRKINLQELTATKEQVSQGAKLLVDASEVEKAEVPPVSLQVAYDSEKRILGILIPALAAALPPRPLLYEEWEPSGVPRAFQYQVIHSASGKWMTGGFITLDLESIWTADFNSTRFDVCAVNTGGGGGGAFNFDAGTTAPQVWGVS